MAEIAIAGPAESFVVLAAAVGLSLLMGVHRLVCLVSCNHCQWCMPSFEYDSYAKLPNSLQPFKVSCVRALASPSQAHTVSVCLTTSLPPPVKHVEPSLRPALACGFCLPPLPGPHSGHGHYKQAMLNNPHHGRYRRFAVALNMQLTWCVYVSRVF